MIQHQHSSPSCCFCPGCLNCHSSRNESSTSRVNFTLHFFFNIQVLNLSVERTLTAKILWFEEILGMKRSEVARMVTTLPCLFGYSIEENMEPKVLYTFSWYYREHTYFVLGSR